jgi:hypothetical protein
MPPALKEPITSFTAVLFIRQAEYIRTAAEQEGVKFAAKLREIVERGIESDKADAEKAEAA